MKSDKIKMSKEEFDNVYEITGETEVKTEQPIPKEQDTTQPEFLTEEEEAFDVQMHDQEPQEDKNE